MGCNVLSGLLSDVIAPDIYVKKTVVVLPTQKAYIDSTRAPLLQMTCVISDTTFRSKLSTCVSFTSERFPNGSWIFKYRSGYISSYLIHCSSYVTWMHIFAVKSIHAHMWQSINVLYVKMPVYLHTFISIWVFYQSKIQKLWSLIVKTWNLRSLECTLMSKQKLLLMASWHGNALCITDHLWRESTGHG